jgi:hypothetical protein
MQSNRITEAEKTKITDANLHLFVERHIQDYWPCQINSQRMVDFLESQFGMSLVDWPYPLHLEQIETAFAYLNSQHRLVPRPEEEEIVDEAAALEARKQQQVRDDYDAQQRAAKIQRDMNMPLNELAKVVSVQNKDFREQRDQNLLPVRSTGMESRAVSTVTLGPKAQARVNVGNANPGLDTHSAEFTRLYAAELSRLRS